MDHVRIKLGSPSKSGTFEIPRGTTIGAFFAATRVAVHPHVHFLCLNGIEATLETPVETDAILTVTPARTGGSAPDPLDSAIANAIDADVSDLAYQHDHYLYGTPKKPAR